MAERELLDVLVQIARIDVVVRADDPTFEDRLERFDAVRVRLAPDVLARVANDAVGQVAVYPALEG